MNNLPANYRQALRARFDAELVAFLTIGRRDNELKPYNKKRVANFIAEHDVQINSWVNEYIDHYTKVGDVQALTAPYNDWIREYIPMELIPM